jgi:hypothetical protein
MNPHRHRLFARAVAGGLLALTGTTGLADRPDEIQVKRRDVFEFAQKPAVIRRGDHVTIRFAVRDYCDAAIAVENAQGLIVRHVAAGVLGDNAPPPFQPKAKEQSLVWDGKDDLGRYVDDKDALTIRVSLGLKPQYERALFWSPYKRQGAVPPLMAPTVEGMYVFDSRGANTVRLYDHDGVYLRTVHPPPADKILKLPGVEYKIE